MKELLDIFSANQRKFIFGSTTAVITNMGLAVGLYFIPNARVSIIGSILLIAIADNVSDSLGIHIYNEAERFRTPEVWLTTIMNYFTRLVASLVFIIFFIFFPLWWATVTSLIYGYLVLIVVSYFIARERKSNPVLATVEHLIIATAVLVISVILGSFISNGFRY